MNAIDRARRRKLLYLVGLVPSLLLLMVSVRIGVLLHHESRAISAYAAGDFDEAREHFAANRVLNPIERWLAPFGEGDALFRSGDHPDAVVAFEAALERVPEEHECVVRVNLGLTHEAHAEMSADGGDEAEATEALLEGREVLTRCKRLDQLSRRTRVEIESLPEVQRLLPSGIDELTPEELTKMSPEELTELLTELLERLPEDRDTEPRSRLAAALLDLRLARSLGVEEPFRTRPPEEPPPADERTREKRREVEERSKEALEDRVKHTKEFDLDAPPDVPAPSPTPQW